ncbi:hypothetical protein ACTS9E_04125 [Empedobacter brevis]
MHEFHPHFNRLKYNEDLFKYIKIDRFRELIKNKHLYFRNISKFSDEYDGMKGSFTHMDDQIILDKMDKNVLNSLDDSYSISRNNSYATCFTLDVSYNIRFIHEYLNNNEGVVIKLKSKNLHESLIDDKVVYSSPVLYNNLDSKLGNIYSPLFNKMKEYTWEKEYRLLYVDNRFGNTHKSMKSYVSDLGDGVNIKIDINKFIDKIFYYGKNLEDFKKEYEFLEKPILEYKKPLL